MQSFYLAALVAVISSTAHAVIIHQESFEGAPGGSYTLSSQFDDGNADFFGRYSVPDNSNVARDDYQTGWDGSFGILGQDHDGDGNAATQSVLLSNIAVGGFGDLSVTASFGALDSEPSFLNFEAAQGDGIKLFSTLDAGTRMLIALFAAPAGGAGDLRLDTNGDGVGDGSILTTVLQDFTFGITGTGTLLALEFELTSTDSFETLALDNVRVGATAVVPVPPALPLMLSGLLAAMLLVRRRRHDMPVS